MRHHTKWFAVVIATLMLVASLALIIGVTSLNQNRIIRVACVGDSITAYSTYPDELQIMLGNGYHVANFGVGRTTVSLGFEKPYLNQTLSLYAHWFKPDIVIIMLGTNDGYLNEQVRSNFVKDYATLVSSFQKLSSKPEIFIVLSPPVFDNLTGLNGTLVENEILPLIKQTAGSLNLPLIDVHAVMVGHPEYFKDGVHPNSEGAKAIATQIFDAITKTSA